MKKFFTLMLTLLLLCTLAPTASFAAEENTITQEEAEALVRAAFALECDREYTAGMSVLDSGGDPAPGVQYVDRYDSYGRKDRFFLAKEGYRTETARTETLQTVFTKDVAKKLTLLPCHRYYYFELDGELYVRNSAPLAPRYVYDESLVFSRNGGGEAEATVLVGQIGDYIGAVEIIPALERTVEFQYTSAGWRISGGTLAPTIFWSEIPQTADPIDPTTVALWASIAVFSLAAVTVALYERKRVMG